MLWLHRFLQRLSCHISLINLEFLSFVCSNKVYASSLNLQSDKISTNKITVFRFQLDSELSYDLVAFNTKEKKVIAIIFVDYGEDNNMFCSTNRWH